MKFTPVENERNYVTKVDVRNVEVVLKIILLHSLRTRDVVSTSIRRCKRRIDVI